MVHAHLDHREAVRLAQPEQRERHADVVVEVSRRGEDRGARAAMRGEDRGEHFLHRGLAVAAGERDQWQREAAPPMRGQQAQREARIGDDHLRKQ